MADRGITFAGNGMADVDRSTYPDQVNKQGMKQAGPIMGAPPSNKGETNTGSSMPQNTVGSVPQGGPIKFAGDGAKDVK